MPPLITPEVAAGWLQIPAGDPRLAALPTALELAQGVLEAHLGAPLADREVVEHVDGGGDTAVVGSFPPVRELLAVEVSRQTSFPLSQISSWASLSTAYAPALEDVVITGSVIHRADGHVFPRGSKNVLLRYRSGYTSETLPAALRSLLLQLTELQLSERGKLGIQSFELGDYKETRSKTDSLLMQIPQASVILSRYRAVVL